MVVRALGGMSLIRRVADLQTEIPVRSRGAVLNDNVLYRSLLELAAALGFSGVHGEFALKPPSVFDRAPDNVVAIDMTGDSHPWIRPL